MEGAFANTRSDQELAPTPAVLGVGSGSSVDPLNVNLANPFLQAPSIAGATAAEARWTTAGATRPTTASRAPNASTG